MAGALVPRRALGIVGRRAAVAAGRIDIGEVGLDPVRQESSVRASRGHLAGAQLPASASTSLATREPIRPPKPTARPGRRAPVTLDLTFFAFAIPAVLFAGISKGGFGSGAGFAATPLLALVLEPGVAIGLMLPLLMLMDVASLRPYWRQWSGRDALRLILGAAPGLALGAWFYHAADPDAVRLLLGVVALGFVLFRTVQARLPKPATPREVAAPWGWLAGLAAGFTSFISHAGGPPVAVYLLLQGVPKRSYQATSVLVFWVINLAKAVPYAMLGIFSAAILRADLFLAPIALFGVWLGVRMHDLVPERVFFAITYTLLTVTGAKLVWDALG